MLAAEGLVGLVLVGLYLFDCLLTLQRAQGLLERRGARWTLRFPSPHYAIRGAPVALLNPLTPARPVLATLPPFAAPDARAVPASRAVRALRAMRALTRVQFVLVLVALPYCLFYAPGWPLLAVLAGAYANAFALILLAARGCRTLGLPATRVAMLAFNGLICIPLSINMMRRILLRVPMRRDAAASLRLLRAGDRGRARSALLAQLREALEDEDEAGETYPRLVALRARLQGESDERN